MANITKTNTTVTTTPVYNYMFVGEIVVNNGRSTVMDILGLPADTIVTHVCNADVHVYGTCHCTECYRIMGTENFIKVHRKYINGMYDWVELCPSITTFEYSKEVKRLSQKYHLPLEVGKILGEDRDTYEAFIRACKYVVYTGESTILNLCAGTEARKLALYEVLGRELYGKIIIADLNLQDTTTLSNYIVRCVYE